MTIERKRLLGRTENLCGQVGHIEILYGSVGHIINLYDIVGRMVNPYSYVREKKLQIFYAVKYVLKKLRIKRENKKAY